MKRIKFNFFHFTVIVGILAVLLITGACQSPRGKEIKSEPAAAVSGPESFLSFIGLRHGDTYEKVLALFGQPDSSRDYEGKYRYLTGTFKTFYVSYYNKGLEIGCQKFADGSNRVIIVRIKSEEGVAAIRNHMGGDSKLKCYGMHKNAIIDTFGKPDEIQSDNYRYNYTSNKREQGMVNFKCYDFWEGKCKEFYVQWFYPEPGLAVIRPQPAPVPTPTPSLSSTFKLEDFLSFAGLRHGDTYKKVLALFGQPESYNDYGGKSTIPGLVKTFYVSFYDKGLTIGCNRYADGSEKVATIRIESEKALSGIREYVGNDYKLDFYGMHYRDIMDKLGTPYSRQSGNYEYHFSSYLGEKGLVDFICYDFENGICKEMYVHWFY